MSSTLPAKIIDMHNHAGDRAAAAKLLERMDEAGIERTVLLGTFAISNEKTLDVVKAHPDRFLGGMWGEPRKGPAGIEELRRYHAEGFRIIKLFPNMGYFPDDDALRPFFEAVSELKMAIVADCGILLGAPGESASYYAHPGRWEKVMRRYPETNFILAHMGGIDGFLQAIMLVTRLRNVYVDTAPGQGAWVLDTATPMVATLSPDRIVWGADCFDLLKWRDHNHAALDRAGFGPHVEKIFYSNAVNLLKGIGAIA